MKRILAVCTLATALFVLMGCGTGSKKRSVEQPRVASPAPEVKTISLMTGEYLGKSRVYKANDKLDQAIQGLRNGSKNLSDMIAFYKKGNLFGMYDALLKDLANHRKGLEADLVKRVQEREKLLAYNLEIEMTILKNKKGHYIIDDLDLYTDKDTKTFDMFGSFSHAEVIEFDNKTGRLSFTVENYTDKTVHTFSGQVVEDGILRGTLSTRLANGGDVVLRGEWSLEQKEVIAARKAKVQAEKEAAEAAKALADAKAKAAAKKAAKAPAKKVVKAPAKPAKKVVKTPAKPKK